MAYRPDDPYNMGIGTPDLGLGNIDQGQVPIQMAKNLNINALKENPMFQEEFVPEKAGMMDFTYGAALKKIPEGISKYDLLKGVTEGTWGLGGGEVLEKNIGGIFPKGTFKGDWNTIGDADINLKQVPGSFKYNIDVDTENIKGKVLEDLEKKGWFDSDDQAYLDLDNIQGVVPGYNPYAGIRGQTAMLDPFSIYAMTKAGLGKKQIVSYLARKEAQQGILKDIETKKAAAAAEEKAAADRKAQQQATIAANREAAKKFGDKPQKIYHQETKSQDRGGRDIGSRVSDSYEKQQSAQYGMLAKGGLVNLFKYGGFLG